MTVQSAPSYPKTFSSLGELTLRQARPAFKQASFRGLHSDSPVATGGLFPRQERGFGLWLPERSRGRGVCYLTRLGYVLP